MRQFRLIEAYDDHVQGARILTEHIVIDEVPGSYDDLEDLYPYHN